MKTSALRVIDSIRSEINPASFPSEPDRYFEELTTRNRHFISSTTQAKLRNLKILIAGCGSTGGACIESLARVGVGHFALADNGSYELNNLNRQHALLENLGQNKAVFHANQLRGINPNLEIKVHPEGISRENVQILVSWADIVMDAVDVTTTSGMEMKLLLHEVSKAHAKPVLTALDMGFCQWGKSYDYRHANVPVLDGVLGRAKAAKHPLKALLTFVPVREVPSHTLQLLIDLLEREDISASQLGCASDLLSAIIVPSVFRFAETGDLVSGWNIDLDYLARRPAARLSCWFRGITLRQKLRSLLRKIP